MPERPIDDALLAGLLDLGIVDDLNGPNAVSAPAMPTTPEGMDAEFFLAVYRYARMWLSKWSLRATEATPCVFVHVRLVNHELDRLSLSEAGWFKDRHEYDDCGGIYVASGDLSVVARTRCHKHRSLDALWRSMKQDDLHDMTHAVFMADKAQLLFRRSSLFGDSKSVRVPVTSAQSAKLSPDDVDRLLWQFHTTHTQLPGCNSLPWQDQKQRIPLPELERRISTNLCFHLNMMLDGDHATTEHYVDGGRLDVRIGREAMETGHGHCALELKVLRSRYPSRAAKCGFTSVSEAEMVRHATEGVDQADDYRNRIRAGSAYLCCFDARLADQDQPAVQAWARNRNVRLRRYFMYKDPTAYRVAKAAAVRAGTLLPGEVN